MDSYQPLLSLSPLDGRYLGQVSDLRAYFSEMALIKQRVFVEAVYLIELVDFLDREKLTKTEKKRLLKLAEKLQKKDFKKIKQIEKEIHHDVKAIEYFIKDSLVRLKLGKLKPWVHWGLTSEDVNNLAYGLMIKGAKKRLLIPSQIQLIKLLIKLADKYAGLVMPARTHGQIAVPTTVGKELVVFASRATFFLEKIISLKLTGKLTGAVGNLNGQQQVFPQKNWLAFSKRFIKKLGLQPLLVTTQINPRQDLVYLLDLFRQLNNVWLDLARDCWLYISCDYFSQKIVKKEVGSSTMPHKINPINFENAEGNLQLANSLLAVLADKLPVSRLQRDLSDSTVKRNLGVGFGHSLLAVKNLIKGLNKIEPNKKLLKKEVAAHPEMLTEALQLILKSWGQEGVYQKIKLKSRGKKVVWHQLINDFPLEQRKILKSWRPEKYFGLAAQLAKKEVKRIKKVLKI